MKDMKNTNRNHTEKEDSHKSFDTEALKSKLHTGVDWVMAHGRIVGPVVLVVCLLITISIALTAGKPKADTESTITTTETGTTVSDAIPVPDVQMEENAVPEINELVVKYFDSYAAGDLETMKTLVNPATDAYLIKVQEASKYTESYTAINVYTKPGPIEGSYMAYVYTEWKLMGYSKAVPGLLTFYVCQKEDGSYYINMDEEQPDNIANYIKTIDFQDDVVDLSNKVSVEFNDLLASDSAFKAYYKDLSDQITAAVESATAAQSGETEEAAETTEEPTTDVPMDTIVKATSVVNMRVSDSENADKVDKAQIGDTFNLLEQKANGWSKVSYNGKEVYIKSEFLEVVSQTPSDTTTDANADTTTEADTTTTTDTPASTNASLGSNGYVTAKTTVNIRKTASETGTKLGTVYMGEKLELVMNQADGWCKVKYKGNTGYVKSDYVE